MDHVLNNNKFQMLLKNNWFYWYSERKNDKNIKDNFEYFLCKICEDKMFPSQKKIPKKCVREKYYQYYIQKKVFCVIIRWATITPGYTYNHNRIVLEIWLYGQH